MGKTKVVWLILVVSLVMVATRCKKKDDPRQVVYKAWNIQEVQMSGDDDGPEASRKTNVIQFTEQGVVKLIEGADEMSGTFQIDETASKLTIVMEGSTDEFTITDLSDTSMTLSIGDNRMVLKARD